MGNSVCFKEMRLEFRITFLLQKRDNFQKRVETYGPPYKTQASRFFALTAMHKELSFDSQILKSMTVELEQMVPTV